MKRLLDVTASILGLAAFALPILLVALLVRIRLGSPILFRQTRPGLHGREFRILKFRTMTDERDANGALLPDGDRLTTFGKFLRTTSIDELPTLWNVLKGDMNIVGPRPEQPEIFRELHDELGRPYRKRQKVLPGITGLAQVNQGYDTDISGVRRKVAFDLEYIGRRSATEDLQIMAKTLPVMVMRKVW